MKREEKNQLTRRRILDHALAEFANQGYGGSSINTISNSEGLSKGIIYHYFETKDDLYLTCVEECFQVLTAYLQEHMQRDSGTVTEQMEAYFGARLAFFQEHTTYLRIFCEAAITPPLHLAEAIRERRAAFDTFNIATLRSLLEPAALRADFSMDEVIEEFGRYQDFINAKYRTPGADALDIGKHEKDCRRALNILLYGVIAREEREI